MIRVGPEVRKVSRAATQQGRLFDRRTTGLVTGKALRRAVRLLGAFRSTSPSTGSSTAREQGRGMAIAGLMLGWSGMGLYAAAVVTVVTVASMVAAG